MGAIKKFTDGLVNIVANLGTGRDKAAHNQYVDALLGGPELLSAYRNSWLARAIIDYPAEDSTRKWRQWRADADQITEIEKLEKRLRLKRRVQDALVVARLYGGAAIYINTKSADQAAPLVSGTEEIRSLVVLSRNSLAAEEIVRDIDSDYYGRPELYRLTSGANAQQVRIHASRLVVFRGATVPEDIASVNDQQGWGDSVLQSTMDAIQQIDATMANMASLVFEAKVDVLKFKGFADLLANEGNDAMVTRRLQTQAAMKGINGALVIDSEDDYEQKSASFASLPDVVSKFMDSVAGASRIPVTRLYGRAAVGLSGSGDGDERVYFDRIGHVQATEIQPAMEMLDECLIHQALGSRPPEIYFEWRPLRQLTEIERADIFGKTATAARSLAGATAGELIPMDALSDALVNELTEQGMLPGLDQAIEKYGTLAEQGLPSENEAPGGDFRDFDPNQPRNERGEWTSSGGGMVGTAAAPPPGTQMSADQAQALYDNREVPDGWFVHGRSTQGVGDDDPLDTGYVTQMTTDIDVADSYAGGDGSVWFLSPSSDAVVMSVSDEPEGGIYEAFARDYDRGMLPMVVDEAIANSGFDGDDAEGAWRAVADGFAPSSIVDSAGFWDDPDVTQWAYESTGVDWLNTPDGAIAFNKESLARGRVNQRDSTGRGIAFVFQKVPRIG